MHGEEHPDVAVSYNNIGTVYKAQGDFTKAVDVFMKALAIQVKVLGDDNPDIAFSYNNIGMTYVFSSSLLRYCFFKFT